MRYGYGYGFGPQQGPAPFVGPLDSLAATLYSAAGLARLLSAYTGPCFRARRSSDNAQMDVGFAGAWPDVGPGSAFATWLGSSTAYVVTEYDQTGGGRDQSNGTTTQQPIIAVAGVVNVGPNGKPVAIFDGVDDRFIALNTKAFAQNRGTCSAAFICNAANPAGMTIVGASVAANAATARATLQRNGSPLLSGQSAGRRIDTDAAAVIIAPNNSWPTSDWKRVIGRWRPAASAQDLMIDGSLTTGAFPGPGGFDSTPSFTDVYIGAHPNLTSIFAGSMSVSVLFVGAPTLSTLDAALIQLLP